LQTMHLENELANALKHKVATVRKAGDLQNDE
jgi:hypothetical protein